MAAAEEGKQQEAPKRASKQSGEQRDVKTEALQEAARQKAAAFQGVDASEFQEQEVHDPEEALEAGFFGTRVALPDEQFALTTGPDSP